MSSQQTSHTVIKYRRVAEFRRSTFKVRLAIGLLKWCLYLLLIPAFFSGMIMGASLQLGSTWGEAFTNVSIVAEATTETYKTHAHLIKLSAEILFSLERDESIDDLDLIVYVAEVRSKTSELSASVDRTLADYLRAQVEKKKAKVKAHPSAEDSLTLKSLLTSSVIGGTVPILFYWILSYLLTRVWLDRRGQETIELSM